MIVVRWLHIGHVAASHGVVMLPDRTMPLNVLKL